MPWTGFSNDPDGKVRPCCLYKGHIADELGNSFYVQNTPVDKIFTSEYMKNLREQFRQGHKPKGCETCIKDEQNGIQSKRQIYNYTLIGSDIDYHTDPEYPVEYQMILSNACNLKCRSCTPSHSNLWQAEHRDIHGHSGYEMPYGQSGNAESVLWNSRAKWLSHVKRLEIVGGEPFYIKQWQNIWNELVHTRQSSSVSIDMSTNCVIYGGDVLENLIPHFERIGVGLSIDGLEDVYNYLRYPGNWSDVKENILKYYQLSQKHTKNFGVMYTHTIGWVNAWYLPEFHAWVNENTPNFRIWNNVIHYPEHMCITTIPNDVKDIIAEKWDKFDWGTYKTDIEGIRTFMYSKNYNQKQLKEIYKTFNVHDNYRNQKLINLIPYNIQKQIQDLIF